MQRKKRRKTGRNAPCPCGSGKKYKRCCQGPERGRAPERSPRGGARVAEEIVEPLRLLTAGDPELLVETLAEVPDERRFRERLVAFGELARAGGPLEEVRFEAAKVAASMVRDRERFAGLPARDRANAFFRHCIRELVTDSFYDLFFDRVVAFATDRSQRLDDRRAAAMAAISTALVWADEDPDPRAMPALEVIFRLQAREQAERADSTEARLQELVERAAEQRSADGLRELLAGEFSDLSDRLEGDAVQIELGQQRMDDAFQETLDLAEAGKLPQVLTAEEYGLVLAVMSKSLREEGLEEADDIAKADVKRMTSCMVEALERCFDEDLLERMQRRLYDACLARACSRREGKKLAAVAAALVAAPGLILMTLAMRAGPPSQGRRPTAALKTFMEDFDVEPLARDAKKRGDEHALVVLRRAREVLVETPGADPQQLELAPMLERPATTAR